MSNVVVLGGGVSGLTSALCLLNQFKDSIAQLTVLAAEFPGDYHAPDYTSPWAGANWASFAAAHDADQIRRDSLTYGVFMRLAETEPAAGVKKYPIKMFWPRTQPLPWYIQQRFVRGIRQLSAREISSSNLDPAAVQGYEFTTVTVSPTTYNAYLISQIKRAGGSVRRIRRLDSLADVVDVLGHVPSLVVNCSGLNAARLLRRLDPLEAAKVFPIKGQILQIYDDLPFQMIIEKLPADDHPLPHQFLNIFPRPEGGCIIGGVAAKHDSSRHVDPELSASILRAAKRHVPELAAATVYNSYVAFRPGREGGVRIALSHYPLATHGATRGATLNVVHNYGIGGAGYQSSYGSAMEVCQYAAKVLNARSKL